MTDTDQPPGSSAFGAHMRDHPDALAALAVAAFKRAVKAAVADNDRLGVPSYGCDDRGQITVRHVGAAKVSATPT